MTQSIIENTRFGILSTIDLLLRCPSELLSESEVNRRFNVTRIAASIAIVGVLIYGIMVGSFSGGVQWWAAPMKLTAGFAFTLILCFPSFYIFSCMSGLRAGAGEMFLLLACSMAIGGAVLIAGIPIVWVFTQASNSVKFIGGLHLTIWFIAVFAISSTLINGFCYLQIRTLALMRIWIAIFVLVSLQMTTTLRPIVGTSESFLPEEKQFFLEHWSKRQSTNYRSR